MATQTVIQRMAQTLDNRSLAGPDSPCLLMVSGGSDSTALAYLAHELHAAGVLGPLAVLHVNHKLRGADAEADAAFVQQLADALDLPCFVCEVDVPALVEREGGNIEAVARHERYAAATAALESLCAHVGAPVADGRILTAHTQDDRVEAFYMRSIVGTGPGGFRSMRYRNGSVVRPLLDVSRQDLQDYLRRRALDAQVGGLDAPVCVRGEDGVLWRTDATNAHTDRFRAYVRERIIPAAAERNPQLLEVLCRSMNLIADEDDMLQDMADDLAKRFLVWEGGAAGSEPSAWVLQPSFGEAPVPLQRRVVTAALQCLLGPDARIETSSVEAVCAAFAGGVPVSGYTTNIQGDLAVSANKHGVRVEPMADYRARRKPDRVEKMADISADVPECTENEAE